MNPRYFKISLWLILMLSILIWACYSYKYAPDELKNEILLLHGIITVTITAPLGIFLGILVWGVLHFLNFEPVGFLDIFIVSVATGLAGYLQWFIVVPKIYEKYCKKNLLSRAHGTENERDA